MTMKYEIAPLNLRDFVRPEPLPFSSHQGIKIKTRDLNYYSAIVPFRDDVRRANYSRRREQTTMGFQTPCNVSYKIIGNPLILEQKQLILHGLGQFSNVRRKK